MSKVLGAIPVHGLAYAERKARVPGTLDEWAERALGPVLQRLDRGRRVPSRWAGRVEEAGAGYVSCAPEDLLRCAHDLRVALRQDGLRAEHVARSFALIREAAHQTIGQRHFDVQLHGGWALLTGQVAEMETGEGKTLTATLAAATAALAGLPVHVVTVNDYLAARDAEAMGPLYRALGLRVGVIVHGLSPEARQAAYGCDVTYCTNKELVFDYLKDRMQIADCPSRTHIKLERLTAAESRTRGLLLRGLYYAIVDEADSVLIDEARTPLIIARRVDDPTQRQVYEEALSLAARLEAKHHYLAEAAERQVRLTPAGSARLAELALPLGGIWRGRQRREAYVHQALSALHLFRRDQHYLVRDGKVHIIDEYTGRVMPDRNWERGLHQMIEVKEGCPLGQRQDTLARISYQRFFRRYLRLAGMTGTAREVARELWAVYRLGVVRIPTNRPLRRRGLPETIHATEARKWTAVVEAVRAAHEGGRAVLVGTRTVGASERLSRLLAEAGLPHAVLNARQDREEATVIAKAAEPGRITVATNMAGRGTDIRLSPAVAAAGGLHVIATERHESGRIDRQLFGRCGRQGDPGTFQAILSLEDELIAVFCAPWLVRALSRWTAGDVPVPRWIGRRLFGYAQRRAERRHARMRRDVLKMDEQIDSALAFAGRGE
ncbi:preprotein translocase subunit SecA [Candidatus Nitrospira bockiana]